MSWSPRRATWARTQDTGEVGYAGISSPGNAPSAITVGSVDLPYTAHRADDTVGPYSSRGPTWYDAFAKPDLVAPGHQLAAAAALQSSLYQENPNLQVAWGGQLPARYLRLTGTSMAAAVATGVVAMMMDAGDDRKVASSYDDVVLALLNAESDAEIVVDNVASGDRVEVIDAQNRNQAIDVANLAPPTETAAEEAQIAEMKQALEAQVASRVAGGDFTAAQNTGERLEQLEAAFVSLYGGDDRVAFDVTDVIDVERSRGITPNAVKAILQYTAIPLDNFDLLTQGAGSLNAVGAVRLANATNFNAESGQYWLRAVVTPGHSCPN